MPNMIATRDWTPTKSFLQAVPSVSRRPPRRQSLVLRADAGYTDGQCRAAFDVPINATFLDLHRALLAANLFDGDHLAQFFLAVLPDGKVFTPAGYPRTWIGSSDVIVVPYETDGPPWWSDLERPVEVADEVRVCSRLGLGHNALWNYDFGDDYYFALRVIGTGPERIGEITMLAAPIEVIVEYERRWAPRAEMLR